MPSFYDIVLLKKGGNALNERLKQLRKALSLSQEAFGSKLGVTGPAVSKIESGDRSLTEQMALSIIREFTEKAQQKENAIMITIGEPDLQPPKEFIDYAYEYAKTHALGYTQAGGSNELRELVAKHYNKYYGSDVNANNILMHIGSMEGISSIFRTILNIDDEVILPTPYFSPYEWAIKLAYGKIVYLDTSEDKFVLKPETIEKVVTNKTKAILFSNPGNPSGYMLKKEEMDELVKYFEKKDIFIIADEIYSAISFYPFTSFTSYPSIKDKVIAFNGFSKSHSMTGWRIGYSASNEKIAKLISSMQPSFFDICRKIV